VEYMTIKKQTGTILSFEAYEKEEMWNTLRRLAHSIDAVYLKELVLLQGSVQVIKELNSFMRENGFDKPIIIDYRLEQSELDSLKGISGLLKNEGAYGMTIMAVYGEDFIKSCRKEAKISLFAIVDVGMESFRDRFDDNCLIENAIAARSNEFEGIVMTSRHLHRIRKVRDAIGKDFPLLSTLERENKLGDTISVGADFEIVSSKLLEK
jgi:orotidine-5'-phosphate decarboxylase